MAIKNISFATLALYVVLALTTWQLHHVAGARILALFPTTLRSHQLMNCAVADALAVAGHNVTVLGATQNVYPRAKYRYIRIDGPLIGDKVTKEIINVPGIVPQRFAAIGVLQPFLRTHNATLAQPKMRAFLKASHADDYDLLLLTYMVNDFHLGLAAHFRCPIVLFHVTDAMHRVHKWMANPSEFAYVPMALSGLVQPLDFRRRVLNFLWYLIEGVLVEGLLDGFVEKYYK